MSCGSVSESKTEGLLPYFINFGGSAAYNPPPLIPPLHKGGLGVFGPIYKGAWGEVRSALFTQGLEENSALLYRAK